LKLKNYVGLNQAAFAIECSSEIKLQIGESLTVNIQSLSIDKSMILMTNSDAFAAPV